MTHAEKYLYEIRDVINLEIAARKISHCVSALEVQISAATDQP